MTDRNRIIATVGLVIGCLYWMYLTHGASGIGWLLFGLVIIWGF